MRTTVTQSDIFAFACVCFEVYTGAGPFPGHSAAAVQFYKGNRPERPVAGIRFAGELWSLVTECWSQDRNYRPDASTVARKLRAWQVTVT
ncbi:hypothetical protein C8R46DRAFT_1073550 [Mycena filopes]|nr:hypothetical protein C8R46DRAFT_1073550 [Mycena filopes]